ncbi:MAG: dihydrolipoyl dehydrogenase [bacterium]|nr:dihydrolipoyl dehydrogenase [bacterium]
MSQSFDVVIIGGGPGGYVAAIRAAQLGMSVACVEKKSTLGGTCLNEGCIPSKALLHSSYKYWEALHHFKDHGIESQGLSVDISKLMARKDTVVGDLTKGIAYLFKKNGVARFEGTASIPAAGLVSIEGQETLQAKHIVIATGSEPACPPGIDVDEKQIVTSTGALFLDKVPGHLVVVGGGYIGLEMGSVWARLGSKVTVVEYMDRIVPLMDHEVGTALHGVLEKQGLRFKTSTKLNSVLQEHGKLNLSLESATEGVKESLDCDILLISVGRRPYVEGLGLDHLGVVLDERGFVSVNSGYQTSVPGVYAIGDVIGGAMLAHKAEEEGVALMEMLVGQKPHVNYDVIPAIVYTHPEVASVGKSEEQLKSEGVEYSVGKFPFMANSRARANGETEGFVKILANRTTDEVLGVHIMGATAGSLIGEAAMAMEYKASAEDIARTCHAHPTESEAIKEAALDVSGTAIHF